MNAILARELAIQLRNGASFDDAHAFVTSVQQQQGGTNEQTTLIRIQDLDTDCYGSRSENVRRLPISRGGRHA